MNDGVDNLSSDEYSLSWSKRDPFDAEILTCTKGLNMRPKSLPEVLESLMRHVTANSDQRLYNNDNKKGVIYPQLKRVNNHIW